MLEEGTQAPKDFFGYSVCPESSFWLGQFSDGPRDLNVTAVLWRTFEMVKFVVATAGWKPALGSCEDDVPGYNLEPD